MVMMMIVIITIIGDDNEMLMEMVMMMLATNVSAVKTLVFVQECGFENVNNFQPFIKLDRNICHLCLVVACQCVITPY